MLWTQESLRGVAISPKQILWLGSWMSFPSAPNFVPIDITDIESKLVLDENNIVHLLLETEVLPHWNSIREGLSSISVSGQN